MIYFFRFIVAGLWLFLSMWAFVSASYVPSMEDEVIQKNITYKINTLERQKLVRIANKIVWILPVFEINSREYYLLNWLYDEIVEVVNAIDLAKIEATIVTEVVPVISVSDTSATQDAANNTPNDIDNTSSTLMDTEDDTWEVVSESIITEEETEDEKASLVTETEVTDDQDNESSEGQTADEDLSDEQNTNEEEVIQHVFDISGKNYEYSLWNITVELWSEVTINFTSESWYHDLLIDELWVATKKVNEEDGTTSVTFLADQVWRFEYYCSVWDHRAQWMVWKLWVVELWTGETLETMNRIDVRVVRNRAYVDMVRWDIVESNYYTYTENAREDTEAYKILAKIAKRHALPIEELQSVAMFTYE